MEDLKTLALGIFGGLIVLLIAAAFRKFRIKTINDDIEFLEFEKNHLAEMKRSSVEMNRSSFRALFALLFILGLANLIFVIYFVADTVALKTSAAFLTIVVWTVFIGLSLKAWRRYENLKNYKEAVNNLEKRIDKLKNKL